MGGRSVDVGRGTRQRRTGARSDGVAAGGEENRPRAATFVPSAPMQLRMDGKVALVTGGSSGLGRAIAKAFVDAGARVVVTGRRADELDAAARDIGAVAVAGDARDPATAARAVAACVERFGGLTTLV